MANKISIADTDMVRDIFVFGSNTQGQHGKEGSSQCALNFHGAVYGKPMGLHGNSYAIVTKNISGKGSKVTLEQIEEDVGHFLRFANSHRNLTFNMTKIGCGLAGFKEGEIKPFFARVPPNVNLPKDWI